MTTPTRSPEEVAEKLSPCMACGMWCRPGELHPYLACLAFKACHDAETVRANLTFIVRHGAQIERKRIAKELREWAAFGPNKSVGQSLIRFATRLAPPLPAKEGR